MELLLILSALLSAVTGAFTGSREAEAPARQEAAVSAVETALETVAVVVQAPQLPSAMSDDRAEEPFVLNEWAMPVLRSIRVTDRLME